MTRDEKIEAAVKLVALTGLVTAVLLALKYVVGW